MVRQTPSDSIWCLSSGYILIRSHFNSTGDTVGPEEEKNITTLLRDNIFEGQRTKHPKKGLASRPRRLGGNWLSGYEGTTLWRPTWLALCRVLVLGDQQRNPRAFMPLSLFSFWPVETVSEFMQWNSLNQRFKIFKCDNGLFLVNI